MERDPATQDPAARDRRGRPVGGGPGRGLGIPLALLAVMAGVLALAAVASADLPAGPALEGTFPHAQAQENGAPVPARDTPDPTGAPGGSPPGGTGSGPEAPGGGGPPAAPPEGGPPFGALPPRVEGPVYVVAIEGTIDEGLAAFFRRAVAEAEEGGAVAFLVEINTFGGRVDSATDIKDALTSLEIPTIAFVTQRAWSAGALIALGAQYLAMAPGSSIGAAEPRPADAKVISALRKEFEAAAEHRGRDPRIAGAMVDASIEIGGLVEEGEILTLSAQQARDLGFIDFIGVRRAEVVDQFGIRPTGWVEVEPNWAERIARFLTDPTVSSILLTIGFLGLISEVSSPGWGVPGTAGVVALALFFGARLIAGLAQMELVLLFVGGLLLIALELFVIPGFGIVGLAGVAAVFASIFFAFPDTSVAVRSIAGALVAALALAIVLLRFLPRTRTWQRIVLSAQVEEAEEDRRFRAATEGEEALLAPGRVGRALTTLRPAGTIEVAGERFDAVTDGEYVEAGAPVRVVRVEGRKIVVRKLVEQDEGGGGEGGLEAGEGAGATGDGAGSTGAEAGSTGEGTGSTGEGIGSTGEGTGSTGEGAGSTGDGPDLSQDHRPGH